MNHEYSFLGGICRAKVGRYLGIGSSILSGVAIFLFLLLFDIAENLGLNKNVPPSVFSLIGAGVFFTFLYFIFNRWFWKWHPICRFLNVPNLHGEWICEGKTLNEDRTIRFTWSGTVTIIQSWDKIRVRLKTATSGSNSTSAAILFDEADGYRLFYSYNNDPWPDQPDLKPHRGFAEITFNKNMDSGQGDYFNGRGRITFGTMSLRRSTS